MTIDNTALNEETMEFMRKREAEKEYFTSQIILWRIITRKVVQGKTTKKEFKLCEWLVKNEYAHDFDEAFENYIKPHRKKVKKHSK